MPEHEQEVLAFSLTGVSMHGCPHWFVETAMHPNSPPDRFYFPHVCHKCWCEEDCPKCYLPIKIPPCISISGYVFLGTSTSTFASRIKTVKILPFFFFTPHANQQFSLPTLHVCWQKTRLFGHPKGCLLLRAIAVARLTCVLIPQAPSAQGYIMRVRGCTDFTVQCITEKETQV